jgi:hypothetical protein
MTARRGGSDVKSGTMLRVDGVWVAVATPYSLVVENRLASPDYLPEFKDYDDGSPISIDLSRVSMFKPIKEPSR